MKRIGVWVSEEFHKRFKDYCKARKISMSIYLKRKILRDLYQYEKRPRIKKVRSL